METREYRTVDKSTWGEGPWRSEPDKAQWPDEATGLPCLLVRNRMGALCGYVGVPPGHPWHGVGYSCNPSTREDESWGSDERTSPESAIEVHGGLTFSDKCHPMTNEAQGVCHVAEAGEPDDVWWFGFDCSHAWDFMPANATLSEQLKNVPGVPPEAMEALNRLCEPLRLRDFETYKDVAYVRAECRHLARQLAEIRPVA